MKPIFALVDGNNFFVSCERVFAPELNNKPVAVLSNNDGCIVARSQEVKDLGIPMAAPVFKHREMLQKHNVRLFSGNFSLYNDMSARMMQTLSGFTEHMQSYSIDEAFLSLQHVSHDQLVIYTQNIREKVKQCLGLPVSIGIAETKTLAKLGNILAKRHEQYGGVFSFIDLPNMDEVLHRIDICDIWGIGRKTSKFLYSNGIYTALQLKNASDRWLKNNLGIGGLRTSWELRGMSCLELDDIGGSKKTILSSRSFGRPVTSYAELKEAVVTYTVNAAQSLREENEVARYIHVWITTNRFKKEEKQYSNSFTAELPIPTSHTPTLIHHAASALEKIYQKGYRYKKAAVSLSGLGPENEAQLNILAPDVDSSRQHSLMQVVDLINRKQGSGTLQFAAAGIDKAWFMKSEKQSGRFTTCWEELLKVRV